MSEQEVAVLVPEAHAVTAPDEEQKKAEKKQKLLAQLAVAREKAASKKKLKSQEAEQTKQRLAELEKRLTQSALTKVEADSEDDEPQKKQIVTRQVEEVKSYEPPSLANEIKKVVCMGALGIASFWVSRRYSQPQQTVVPHSPAPAKRPAPAQSNFIEHPAKRRLPPVPLFNDPVAKSPVGASGFFQ